MNFRLEYQNQSILKTLSRSCDVCRAQVKSSLFVQQRDQAAVIINAMLNRNDKAMKALTVTLM